MADFERALRADPQTTPQQISFLDRVQERRELLTHLGARHNRVFPRSYVELDELRNVHAVLHEDDE